MLEFEGVTKLYKSVIGVNDISLKLDKGSYGLLGTNGSGKTTLINLILGQLKPTIGQVKIFGINPWKNQSALTKIGYCPAVEPMYPSVSGIQWAAYLVELQGFTRHEAWQRAKSCLQTVGMEDSMNRSMGGYSLGMRQRVKLAQAMAHDPELLILDEPFNGLDPVGRIQMTQYLQEWVSQGRSLILASHILHEVETVDPSLLLISGGRLLASGSPAEVRSILADCPNAILIRSSDDHRLVSAIVNDPGIHNVSFEEDSVIVTVANPSVVLELISKVTLELNIEIYEIRGADESLQDIFSTLMRLHRGELQRG